MIVNRFDRGAIKASKRTQEGYLRIDGSKIARVGIQIYRRADGSEIRELREPEQVFDAESLASFAQLPLTNTHPPGRLTAETAARHAVGSVGAAIKLDDKWISAPIVVWDAATIQAIESGRQQLSAGYSCELVEESGEWNGQKFDCRQTNIRANHLAVVSVARAGAEARLKLDRFDAEAIEIGDEQDTAVDTAKNSVRVREAKPKIEEPTHMAHELKVDGFKFEVNDANAQAAVDRVIASARKDGEDKFASEKTRADNADKLCAATQKTLSELQAKHDGLLEKIKTDGAVVIKVDGAEVAVVDFFDAAKRAAFLKDAIAKRTKTRATLLAEARRHLGANEKLDELEDIAIKAMVVKKLKPEAKLDGRDATYIEARFDGAIEDAAKVSPIDLLRTTALPPVVEGAPAPRADHAPSDDPAKARQAMIARQLGHNKANGAGR
jgi:hypothetical protein